MKLHFVTAALLLSTAAHAAEEPKKPADEVKAEAPKPSPFTFAFHGFVSTTLYGQTAQTGVSEGQQAMWSGAPGVGQSKFDHLAFGADVRQTRLNFSIAGPKVLGATPKAVVETDFFGGYGAGALGDVSLTPRLRWAYAELDYGNGNRINVGQMNDLIYALAPVTLAHITFGGYGSGNIGWRRPGIFAFSTMGDKKAMNTEVAVEVGRAQWNDTGNQNPNGIGSQNTLNNAGMNLGEASGLPAVEARLTLANGKVWQVGVTGHWNRVDASGFGVQNTAAQSDLDVIAGNFFAKVVAGPITVGATGFTGKNLAPLVGNFLQFQNPTGDAAATPAVAPNGANVHTYGGWAQAGLNFTPQLSLFGFLGAETVSDFAHAAAVPGELIARNIVTSGLLQYREGGYGVGLEYFHYQTYYVKVGQNTRANQVALSANYFF